MPVSTPPLVVTNGIDTSFDVLQRGATDVVYVRNLSGLAIELNQKGQSWWIGPWESAPIPILSGITSVGVTPVGTIAVPPDNGQLFLTWYYQGEQPERALPAGAPASVNAVITGIIDVDIVGPVDAGGNVKVDVEVFGASLPAGTNSIGTVVLPSDATPGAAPPAIAQLVAGSDGTDARTIKTDVFGNVDTNIIAPLPVGTNTIGKVNTVADATAGALIPTTGFMIMASDGTDAREVHCDSSGNLQITASVGIITTPNAPTLTQVAGATSSTVLLAANAARKGVIIVNDQGASTAGLYIAFAATATTAAYTYRLAPGDTLEFNPPIYTGAISGIWSANTGHAVITELT